MTEDHRQVDALALADEREIRSLRGHRGGALGIETGLAESPSEELADRIDGLLRGILAGVVAHHGDAHRVLVESACVCALNRLVESTGATFEDLTVLVDEDVVADVAPTERLRVVRVDGSDDLGRFGLGVVVAACGVVHGGTTEEVVDRRCGATDRLIGTPLRAGDDLGACVTGDGSGDVAQCRVDRRRAGGDEHGADVTDRSSQLLGRAFRRGFGLGGICCRRFDCRCRGRGIDRGRILLAQWLARRCRGVAQWLFRSGGGLGRRVGSRQLDDRNLGNRCSREAFGSCTARQRRQQNLHCVGQSDEDRFGALLGRGGSSVVGRAVHRSGLQPRAPGSVLELAANLSGRTVELLGGQGDHAERGVLLDLLDGGTERRAGRIGSLGVHRCRCVHPGNGCLRGRVARRGRGETRDVGNLDRRDHDGIRQRQVLQIGEPKIGQRQSGELLQRDHDVRCSAQRGLDDLGRHSDGGCLVGRSNSGCRAVGEACDRKGGRDGQQCDSTENDRRLRSTVRQGGTPWLLVGTRRRISSC